MSRQSTTLILATLNRLKPILGELEATGSEPSGSDEGLIGAIERMASEEVPAAPTIEPPLAPDHRA